MVGAWVAGRSVGSPAVVVGVIDDGRDPAHPHRAGPSGGLANAAAWDPAHDVHRPPPDVPDPGLPVGRADGRQVLGAAPGATVVSIGAGHDRAVAEVERWFDRATERGAWIVSCRWGAAARLFPLSERHRDAIARCARGGRGGKDCVIVVAAGNDGRDIDDPAGRTLDGLAVQPDTIAVATPRSLGGTAGDSDFGDRIWACAPPGGIDGRGVPTADDGIRAGASGHRHPPSIWPAKSPDRPPRGRASACTLVAGICALVLTANPDLTAAEVKRLLARTARRVGPAEAYENGHSRRFGHGCVDAEAAVRGAIALRYAAADAAAD